MGANRRRPQRKRPWPSPCRSDPVSGSRGLLGASLRARRAPADLGARRASGWWESPRMRAARARAQRTAPGRPRPLLRGSTARRGQRSTCAPPRTSVARCTPLHRARPPAPATKPRIRLLAPPGRTRAIPGASEIGTPSCGLGHARSRHPASGQSPRARQAPARAAKFAGGRRARWAEPAKKASALLAASPSGCANRRWLLRRAP
mmetsp:Transcript_116631/g.329882  ORF Transcript_116631/g.329882 Transcript_116631/m.329882 type:complete len:205 (+) Transcript_116631:576-1190(+)